MCRPAVFATILVFSQVDSNDSGQLIQTSGTRKSNLRVPDIWMSYRDISTWLDARIIPMTTGRLCSITIGHQDNSLNSGRQGDIPYPSLLFELQIFGVVVYCWKRPFHANPMPSITARPNDIVCACMNVVWAPTSPVVIWYIGIDVDKASDTRHKFNNSVYIYFHFIDDIDDLVQDYSNSSAWAMELLQSCTKPSTSG